LVLVVQFLRLLQTYPNKDMSIPLFPFPNPRHGRSRTKDYIGIILHDPAITHKSTAKSVANYVNREGSGGWYHIILDKDEAWEYRNPDTHLAGHAGKDFNSTTIGVCLAQQNVNLKRVGSGQTVANYRKHLEEDCEAMRASGYDVHVVERNSSWYPYEITLDEQIARDTALLLDMYANQYNIPKIICTTKRETCVDKNMMYTDRAGVRHRVGVAAHKQLIGASRMDISHVWMTSIVNHLIPMGWSTVD